MPDSRRVPRSQRGIIWPNPSIALRLKLGWTRERAIARIGSTLARLLFLTMRFKMEDRAGFSVTRPESPLIFAFWHNRILACTIAHMRYYRYRSRRGLAVLTSASKDGEILAQLMSCFHIGAIRGSSSRRGSRSILECLDWLKSGGDLAVTPDGPRGPRYSLGAGLILLAQTSAAPILPVHVHFTRSIALKSWDAFRIPLPFSTVEIIFDTYQYIPPTPTPEAFEAERLRIETLLKNEAD
jgi:lysophospholipid acyltransferase (LPLAT)-like uncharacterized protein